MNNKHRINIMDIILLTVIICIIITFGFISFNGKSNIDFSQKSTFDVIVFTDEILIKNADLFKTGDTVTLTDTGEVLGVIKSIKLENTNLEVTNKATNTSAVYKLPDKKNATILIRCNGEIKDGSFFIGDSLIMKGDHLSMHTPAISFEAAIINVVEGD